MCRREQRNSESYQCVRLIGSRMFTDDDRKRRYIRRVTSTNGPPRWRVEVWLPHPICKVWLGSYYSESAAAQVLRNWLRAGAKAHTGLPSGVLPKWVVRDSLGQFWAEVRVGRSRRLAVRLGPFPTAEAAHLAALARWRFGGWAGRPRDQRGASPYRLVVPAGSLQGFQ